MDLNDRVVIIPIKGIWSSFNLADDVFNVYEILKRCKPDLSTIWVGIYADYRKQLRTPHLLVRIKGFENIISPTKPEFFDVYK